MDVRGKLIEILRKPIFPHELVDPTEAVADYLLDNGVTVQEWIPAMDVQWLGEDIAKLCIRYMTEYADFHGYASQKKVKAHIIRLLQAEADGRIAIMPQPTEGE